MRNKTDFSGGRLKQLKRGKEKNTRFDLRANVPHELGEMPVVTLSITASLLVSSILCKLSLKACNW